MTPMPTPTPAEADVSPTALARMYRGKATMCAVTASYSPANVPPEHDLVGHLLARQADDWRALADLVDSAAFAPAAYHRRIAAAAQRLADRLGRTDGR